MGKELNWREVWEEKQKQRMKPLKITFDPEFRAGGEIHSEFYG